MSSAAAKAKNVPRLSLLEKLASIQIGGSGKKVKIKKKDLIFIFRNISILVENGLPLPRALDALVREKSLKKYCTILTAMRQRVESGESFSGAMALFPDTFSELVQNQIRIGERSGTMPATLKRLTNQLEHGDNLKSMIIKKLTYPCMLMFFGGGAVSFMLLYVVPTFEKTYKESNAKLPAITQFMIDAGQFGKSYGWMILLAIAALVGTIIYVRRIPAGRFWMDAKLLKIPLVGDWLKNIAVLQFVEVLGNLMEAGFTVVNALKACGSSIGNRAVRHSVEELHTAILRGERLSNELERHGDLFPPVVNQLVVVGEKTGTLAQITGHIRTHLRREVERYTNAMIGSIEPIMTIGLAFAIGGILLAIYLPMFDMIGSMDSAPGGH